MKKGCLKLTKPHRNKFMLNKVLCWNRWAPCIIITTKLTLSHLRFKLSRTQTSVTRSVYLLCGITNGQLLKTSVWDNPASADTSLQSASLLIMQRAPFTGLSLLPAAQLGVSLIGQLQWSTANACLQSVSTEPFTLLAGVRTDPIREGGRETEPYIATGDDLWRGDEKVLGL